MTTPILGLTELSNTSGERSTLVDSYRILDGMFGKTPAVNININTPPVSPNEGDSALISSAPTGDFAGFAGHLALYLGTGWHFIAPTKLGFVQTESGPYEPNVTLDGWIALTLPAGSVLTTKGDLLAFGTADTRLPVGTDGQALIADSAEALGVKWDTISGGGSTPTSQPLAFYYEAEDLTDEKGGSSLTQTGTVPIVSGKIGNAFQLDGSTGNYLSTPNAPAHAFGDNDWFIAAWAQTTGGTGTVRAIYSKDEYLDNEREIAIGFDHNEAFFCVIGGTSGTLGIASTSTIAPNTWYHVAISHNATTDTLKLYLNGVEEAVVVGYAALGSPPQTLNIPAFVGARRTGNSGPIDIPFNGLIDQLIKGDFVPTQAQIDALYNSGNGIANAQDAFSSNGSGGGTGITLNDGITTVSSVTDLTITGGAIIDNTGGAATLSIGGGGLQAIDVSGFSSTPTSLVDGTFNYATSSINALLQGLFLRIIGSMTIATPPVGILNFESLFDEVVAVVGVSFDYAVVLPNTVVGERLSIAVGSVTLNDISAAQVSPIGSITGQYLLSRRATPSPFFLHSMSSYTATVSASDNRWSGSTPVALATGDVISFNIELPVS